MSANPDYDGDGWDYRDDDYDGAEDDDCSWCGGHPDEQECGDPIQCCNPRCDGQWHPCDACNGTGLASKQVMW